MEVRGGGKVARERRKGDADEVKEKRVESYGRISVISGVIVLKKNDYKYAFNILLSGPEFSFQLRVRLNQISGKFAAGLSRKPPQY